MKKRDVQKHLKKLWKKMRTHYRNFVRCSDAEELHQFRVQVKKLRSFITLLSINQKNCSLQKHFKPVKKIFKAAGVIRDAALHQDQARAHQITLPSFFAQQKILQKRKTKELIAKRNKQLHQMKKVKKHLLTRLHGISAAHIADFYSTQLHDTSRLLQQHHFDEQLHDGRKMLKHLLYNQSVISGANSTAAQINFDYIDELQHLLGQWHDNQLAFAYFEQELDAKDLHDMQMAKKKFEKEITEKAKDFEVKVRLKKLEGNNPIADKT